MLLRTDQMNSNSLNSIPDYLKSAIYGSDDPDVIAQKEKALRDLHGGMNASEKGEQKTALKMIESAVNIFTETKDELLQAFSLFFMAEIYYQSDILDEAKNIFQKSHQIFLEKDNRMFLSTGQKIREIDRLLKGEGLEFQGKQLLPF